MAKKRRLPAFAKGKKNSRSLAQAKLPAGFTAIDVGGGFGAWWDHYKQAILTGKVVGMDSMKVEDDDGKKKTRRILRVKQDNGVTVSVGESHNLRELFDMKKLIGRKVYLQFLGQKPFKNKKGKTRKVNVFAAAVN